ncbi:MAG: phospho-N-acetylmuramoyl-pentapeptide-transferase [Candidatus Theseobacter exili]|nr:phospho-N-acetylmuramoyl-pentapeptide-transferase [Candidatus Theseobacter exili]
MLYKLFIPLKEFFFGFNVFRYITFRSAAAAATSMFFCIIVGPFIIRWLKSIKAGQEFDREGYDSLSHFRISKKEVPTMGGIIIIAAVCVSMLLWGNLANRFVQAACISFLWLGFIGFMDDLAKVRGKSAKGITPSQKIIGQVLLALLIGVWLYFDPAMQGMASYLSVPFFKKAVIHLGFFYLIFVILVIVGTSNAVNLTDGLDGLAIGCTIVASFVYMIMSYLTGHARFAEYLHILYLPMAGELAVFCAALAGAGLGFLWFNAHPAQVIMGDTGSLAIGGAIGVVALLIKKELMLIFVGGIFVVEAVSVILQVGYFKWKKKRIFAMAPLHHHYELKGIPENKITVRFWILAIIFALISLSVLKLR